MNKLLKILDMTEEEQYRWAVGKYSKYLARYPQSSLADLAFRLRDEAMSSSNLRKALLDVHQKAEGPQNREQDYGFWFLRAKPIHWIIAALIAKENE